MRNEFYEFSPAVVGNKSKYYSFIKEKSTKNRIVDFFYENVFLV